MLNESHKVLIVIWPPTFKAGKFYGEMGKMEKKSFILFFTEEKRTVTVDFV